MGRRSRLPVLAVLTVAAVVGLGVAATGGVSSAAVPSRDAPPTVVRVPVVTERAPDSRGANGIVEISLGGRSPIRVMLDTGSVGLRVFPGAWSGPVSDGFATASFSIGGVRSQGPLTFQVAASSNAYLDQWMDTGVVGILGIGLSRSPVVNPLTLLPGDLGRRWSVHFDRGSDAGRPGRLVLGAVIPADADATFRPPAQGRSPSGVPLWADRRVPACWSVDGIEACADTWFDSGFHLTRLSGRVFADLPSARVSGLLPAGIPVRMAAVGAAFDAWGFVSGRTPSRDAVELFSPHGRPRVNTGNAAFFDHTVTYDLDRGLIAVS